MAHFAHKPPTDCAWARGETRAHLKAKRLLRDALRARGVRAEVEHVLPSLPGDRRADVAAWSPSGELVVFELQHTSVVLDEIERRAGSYAAMGAAQVWIPFLSQRAIDDMEPLAGGDAGDMLVERYSARPFERWVHGLHGKRGMWLYDPAREALWRGRLAGHQIYVEESSWYEEGGEEASAGGYHRWSRRWRELTLWGPYPLDRVRVRTLGRGAFSARGYNWPACRVAEFVPE